MLAWKVGYFPATGERNSPVDYIQRLTNYHEVAIIKHRIDVIRQLPIEDWPVTWIKRIQGLYQLNAGAHRIYFDVDTDTLVILYICRKVSQKAKKQDLLRAMANQKRYYSE